MARPSQKLDEKLVRAGCELIREQGLSRLSLRAVAKKAGVNLGMFHYHFKNKAEFSARCTAEAYAEFYQGFETDISEAGTTEEKLRRGLLALARYSRDNRHFIMAMLRDLEDKNAEAWEFMRNKFPPPHGRVIMALIKRGQKEGLLIKVPAASAMGVLMGAITFPNLLGGLAEKMVGSRFLNLPKLAVQHYFLSDKALSQRVDIALRGLLAAPAAGLRRNA